MSCSDLEITPGTFGCMDIVVIGSSEIYEHTILIKDILDKSPVPVSFAQTTENIKGFIENVKQAEITLKEFKETFEAPKIKSPVNPNSRRYNKRRFK